MNALDTLEHGHQTVMDAIAGLPREDWNVPALRNRWTVKDAVAHLASLDYVLSDALYTTFYHGPSPLLNRWVRNRASFEVNEVEQRRYMSVDQVVADYQEAHFETLNLIVRIPPAELQQADLIPWYGDGHDLEDFIVREIYGPKYELSADITRFRKRSVKMQTTEIRIGSLAMD